MTRTTLLLLMLLGASTAHAQVSFRVTLTQAQEDALAPEVARQNAVMAEAMAAAISRNFRLADQGLPEEPLPVDLPATALSVALATVQATFDAPVAALIAHEADELAEFFRDTPDARQRLRDSKAGRP